jgi:RNA polymerase sigma factor (sigma-70 family)
MIARRDLAALVAAAVADDPRAWELLVAELTPMIRAIARRHRLGPFDQDEVVQRTFLALVRNIARMRDPLSVGAWTATTARRASLAVIGDGGREIPTEHVHELEAADGAADERLLEAERRAAVRSATSSLPAHQRELVAALSIEPALSQRQVSERLGIPIGSVGPTRQRCLERMRKDSRVSMLLDEHVPPTHRPTRPQRPAIELG